MWIARDRADVVRTRLGTIPWRQWGYVASLLGLEVIPEARPADHPATIIGTTIHVDSRLPETLVALYVWHEIAHFLLHSGRESWWKTRPQGHLTVAGMECQAWDLAVLLPDWGPAFPEIVQIADTLMDAWRRTERIPSMLRDTATLAAMYALPVLTRED